MDLFGEVPIEKQFNSGGWNCLSGVRVAWNACERGMLEFCRMIGMKPGQPPPQIDHTFLFSGPHTNEKQCYAGYAPQFAAYIRDNKLGTLTESHLFKNALYRDKTSQIFCWTPDMKALHEWFLQRQQLVPKSYAEEEE